MFAVVVGGAAGLGEAALVLAGDRLVRLAGGGARGARLVHLPRLLDERGAVLLPLLPQRGGGPLVPGPVSKSRHLKWGKMSSEMNRK
jgi:hypothetical protein